MKRKTKQNKTKKDDSLRQLFVCVPVVLFDSRFSFFSPYLFFYSERWPAFSFIISSVSSP
jgi:hypothetical protein